MVDKIIWKGERRPLAEENKVIMTTDNGEIWVNLPLYLDEVNHSPTGFEWGYLGSGPSQLAYAILRSLYEIMFGYDKEEAKQKALSGYQSFKEYAIAKIKTDEWTITSDDVRIWWVRKKEEWII
jgi:hypothetical protein